MPSLASLVFLTAGLISFVSALPWQGASEHSAAYVSPRRLSRRAQQCFHTDECRPDLHGNVTCSQGFCSTKCEPGYELSRGSCHRSLATRDVCPPGTALFMGFCLSGPAAPLTRKTCGTATDCGCQANTFTGYPTYTGASFVSCEFGLCTARCKATYIWNAGLNMCVPSGATCQSNAQCSNGPAGSNFLGVCGANGLCTEVCASGYTEQNGCCVQQQSCETTACLPITGGTSSCSNGQCSYTCYSPSATAVLTGACYTCIDTASDPNNCGAQHLVCPGPSSGAYASNGGGLQPACINGACALI